MRAAPEGCAMAAALSIAVEKVLGRVAALRRLIGESKELDAGDRVICIAHFKVALSELAHLYGATQQAERRAQAEESREPAKR